MGHYQREFTRIGCQLSHVDYTSTWINLCWLYHIKGILVGLHSNEQFFMGEEQFSKISKNNFTNLVGPFTSH